MSIVPDTSLGRSGLTLTLGSGIAAVGWLILPEAGSGTLLLLGIGFIMLAPVFLLFG